MRPLSSAHSPASAEAVFGSTSRGDSDQMSDRDILIVDDDLAVLKRRTLELQRDGWSVASYTFNKLHFLAQRGALFIQHLKVESKVLRDDKQRLTRLLTAFTPLATYRAEIQSNDRLANLASIVPSGSRGGLLAADILYVALRNFGILRLAERGIHTYSFTSILDALESERIVSAGSSKILFELRSLKYLYRAGENICSSRANAAVVRALTLLPSAHFPAKLDVLHPKAVILKPAPQGRENGYLQLRDLERRLVALQTLKPCRPRNIQMEVLSRWIADPRRYASISARLAPQLRRTLLSQVEGVSLRVA